MGFLYFSFVKNTRTDIIHIMINQQLLDFIKEQLQKGISKEIITKELLSNGWGMQDIEEGFNALSNLSSVVPNTLNVSPQIKNHPGRNIFLVVLLLFLVGASASAFYFRNELPILKDLVKSDANTVEGLNQNQTDQVSLEKTQLQQPKTLFATEAPSGQDSLIKKEDTVANKITTTKTVENQKKDDLIDIHTKIEVTQNVDCGSDDCFQQKFSSCQQSVLKGDAGFASVEYKIIGPATGGCKMTFKYTTNPNPDWINKEMTCIFDNKIGFQKSIENTFSGIIDGSVVCSGTLYTILKSM